MAERRFALVVTSHRGDLYLPSSLATWQACLPWDRFEQRVLVDDSASGNRCVVQDEFDLTSYHPERTGLSATVWDAWMETGAHPEITHVFHLEEDFQLTEPVDLDALADVLDEYGNLAQMVLKRQPWSPEEQAAGGIVERFPDEYVQVDEPHPWLQHRRIFSLNPCLIPARVVRAGWPAGNEAEQTDRLLVDGAVFGMWGRRDDPPRCLHVGTEGGMGTPGWKQ